MKILNEQSDRPASDGFLSPERLRILSPENPDFEWTSIIKIKQTYQVPCSFKKQLNISLKMCILFAR